ncbi:hypothetical protein [Pseudomonas sp. Irchel 3F5]|uniref:hypothetical protein n=1 Tax=Pseudomonas sp. Irchel 3F5 TaxID=2009002 RepID=UPI000BA4E210|nr:hypothetical protein [Pseudomonas sp. Irchel 3F5]
MAKDEGKPVQTPLPVPQEARAQVYRDTRFTSRVLILPDGRSLAVARARVIAEAGDTVAQGYLSKHPDLKLQPE